MCRRAPPGISSENNILMYIRRLLSPSPSLSPLHPSPAVLPRYPPSSRSLSSAPPPRVSFRLTLFLPIYLFLTQHLSPSLCQLLLLCRQCLSLSSAFSAISLAPSASSHLPALALSVPLFLSLSPSFFISLFCVPPSPSPPRRFVLGAFFDVSLSYVRARVCCAGIVHVRRRVLMAV